MAKRDEVPGLGEKLKAMRDRVGMTQEEVAVAASLSRPGLSAYESGAKTPTLAVLYRLAATYGVKLSELVPERPEETTPVESEPETPTKGKKK